MKYHTYFLCFLILLSSVYLIGCNFGESIDFLPCTINHSGHYFLNTSTIVNSSYAILINTNNVILDGNQNIIRGNGEFGIIAKGKNITINNLTLIGWKNGVLMTSNDTILNNVNIIKNESLLKIKIDNPDKGVLSIISSPTGSLFINNIYIKDTPCEIELNPGRYSIIVYNQSENKIYSINLDVRKGIKYIIQPTLYPIRSNDTTTFNGIFNEPISIGILLEKDKYSYKNGSIVVKIKNPNGNKKSLIVEEYHKLPKDLFIGVGGYNIEGDLATKIFSVYPSNTEFVDKLPFSINKAGKYIFYSQVIYYPEGNKSLYKEIELAEIMTVAPTGYTKSSENGIETKIIFGSVIILILILAGIYVIHNRKK